MKNKKWFLIFATLSFNAVAFDLEDYATTLRATRDAYLKASVERDLAYGPLKNLHNLYVQSCYKISGNELLTKNIQGLHDGMCNEDTKQAHPGGGVYRPDGSLGDMLYSLILATPLHIDLPLSLTANSDPVANTMHYRMRVKNTDIAAAYTASINLTFEKDLSCTITKNYLGQKVGETDSDFNLRMDFFKIRYNARYAAYVKASSELQLATGPFKAAFAAYQAATSVYVAASECTQGTGSKEYYDPYVP